nr:uncharacterized protein LOC109765843 [Aegilops tauschii subsp. strangulata]
MPYIYWEKLEPIGVDAFDPLSREYPLMLNWPETEGKKRDDYDNIHGRGTGNIENCISEEYRCAKVAREGTVLEEETKKTKRKGGGRSRKPSMSVVSSNTNYSMDRVMTYIKLLDKEVLNIPERCAQMVMERLNTEGVMYKPNKRDNVDEFDDVGEGVGMQNGKYKSKYWLDVESPTNVMIGTSFTGMNDTSVPVDDTGAPATTPGKGEATDPFIIDDNGNSPSSASTVRTKDFPSMSRTPQNADISGESMGGLSPTKSEETFESFPAKSNVANGDGSQDNEDLFASSSHSILASSLNMTPDHIEAAKVFVETLASPKKHAHRTVVNVPPPDGDICTPAMLHDVLTFKWLNGVRAEISKDVMEANSTLQGKKYPDVSSWPINEYEMLRQKDGHCINSSKTNGSFDATWKASAPVILS